MLCHQGFQHSSWFSIANLWSCGPITERVSSLWCSLVAVVVVVVSVEDVVAVAVLPLVLLPLSRALFLV